MRMCDVAGCAGKHYGRGLCQKHYLRQRNAGGVDVVRTGHRYQEVDAGSRLGVHVERRGDCLIYTRGHTQRSGHTMVSYKGRQTGVHRVAYELAFGPIPDGLCVCHRCDVPRCIEPSHLFLGTVADNNRDRDEKGRGVVPTDKRYSPTQGPTVHGTLTAYVRHKCRCDECRAAMSSYRVKRRSA